MRSQILSSPADPLRVSGSITDPVESYHLLVVNLQKSGCVYVIPCWYMLGSQKFGQKKFI